MMQYLTQHYLHSLKWIMRHAYLAILLWLGAIAGSIYLYQSLPKKILPEQDTVESKHSFEGMMVFLFRLCSLKF